MALDRTDFEILEALQNDARLSNKELAARVDLAASSCLERVRRLRDSGVLRGTHAEVDPEAVGIGLQAMIAVRMQQHSRDLFESFRMHLIAAETLAVYHLAGANDFFVHAAVRDSEHLRDFVLDEVSGRSEVQHIETAIIFRYDRSVVLPNYVENSE